MQLTGVYEGREVTVSASPSDTLASLRAKLLDGFISNWQADQYTVADLMSGLVTREYHQGDMQLSLRELRIVAGQHVQLMLDGETVVEPEPWGYAVDQPSSALVLVTPGDHEATRDPGPGSGGPASPGPTPPSHLLPRPHTHTPSRGAAHNPEPAGSTDLDMDQADVPAGAELGSGTFSPLKLGVGAGASKGFGAGASASPASKGPPLLARSAMGSKAGGSGGAGSGSGTWKFGGSSSSSYGGRGSTPEDTSFLVDGRPPGQAGLSNMGNTCFMNASLQCLAHSVPLMTCFLTGAYAADLNRDNPLGTKGELAESFAHLMTLLWQGGIGHVTPRRFKDRIGCFAPQFVGYAQHDSQEFLAYLLDGLHEDLNRIKAKPYIEDKDDAGLPDHEVASKAWSNYRTRNDSAIVDHFQGLYKSTLDCPHCGHNSRKFDPFMYLSLPLPESRQRSLSLHLVHVDGAHPPARYVVDVANSGTLQDVLVAVAAVAGLPEAQPASDDKPGSLPAPRAIETCLALAKISRGFSGQEEVEVFRDLKVRVPELAPSERPHAGEFLVAYYYSPQVCGPGSTCATSEGQGEPAPSPAAQGPPREPSPPAPTAAPTAAAAAATAAAATAPGGPCSPAAAAPRPLVLHLKRRTRQFGGSRGSLLAPPLLLWVPPDLLHDEQQVQQDLEQQGGACYGRSEYLVKGRTAAVLLAAAQRALAPYRTAAGAQAEAAAGAGAGAGVEDAMECSRESVPADGATASSAGRASPAVGEGQSGQGQPDADHSPAGGPAAAAGEAGAGGAAGVVAAVGAVGSDEGQGVQPMELRGPEVQPFNMWADDPAGSTPSPEPSEVEPAFRLLATSDKGEALFSSRCSPFEEAGEQDFMWHFALEWPEAVSHTLPRYDLTPLAEPAEHDSAVAHAVRKRAGKQPVSLTACVEAFLQPEQLSESDSWYCPSCKQHVQADKKLDVWALPHLLVVHLKRFSYTRSSRDKLETPVLFGQELDLGPYVLAHPPTAAAPPVASHAPQSPCASLPLVDDGKAAAPGAAAAPAGAAAAVGDIAMPDASANISAVSSGTQPGGRGAGAGAGVEAGAGSEVVGWVSEGSVPCPQLYQLYAVINHYGSLGGGHYTAFVQEPGSSRWFAYDDSRVTPVSIEEVCSPAAYVLFFRRKDDAARDPPDLLARLQEGQARLHQEAGLCLHPSMNGQVPQLSEAMHGKPLQPGSPSPSHPIAHHARQHATSSLPMFDDEDEQQQGEGWVGDAGKVGDCSQPQPPQLGLGSLAGPLHAPQRSRTGLECGGGSAAAAAAAAAAAQGGSRGDPAWPSAAQALSGLAGGAANLISAAVSRLQGQAGCWVEAAGGGAGGAAGPGPGPGPAALMPGTPDASDSAPALPTTRPGPLSTPAPPAPPLAGPELPHGLRCHAVPGSHRSHVGVTGGGESVTSLPGTPSVDTPGRGGPASTCVAQCSRLGWQAGGSLASVQVSDDQGSHQGRAQEMCDLGDDGDLSLYRDMEYTGEGGEDLEQQGGGLGGGQPGSCPDLMGGLQDMDMQAEPFAAGTGGQGAWQLGATSGSGQAGGEAAALELTSLGVRAAAGSAR